MINISILILSLLQSQPTRISKLVWVGAIVIFVAAISMLVYFLTRLKKNEKEQEEDDWRTSRRSLFVEPAEPVLTEPPIDVEQPVALGSEVRSDAATPGSVHESDGLPVDAVIEPSDAAPLPPPPTPLPVIAFHEPPPDQLELNRKHDEERATQLLGSLPVESAGEGAALGDEVWADLDSNELPGPAEPAPVARVEQRTGRERFEPPAIRPLTARTPFEPPRTDRIVPGSTAASANEFREASRPREEPQAEPSLPVSRLATPDAAPTSSAAGVLPAASGRKPAGSVLGLPVESSRGPLILGEPSQQRSDVGIGALSNYGKETGPEGGRGGLIALSLTILIVGGGALAYIYQPTVHARVDSLVSRMRRDPPPEPPAPPTRALISFGSSESVKNVVKAKGAISNTSTEALDNLSIEIHLERIPKDPDPGTRTIPVTPNRLEPGQQGRYEFEYDGSRATGYPVGYRVSKLLSNGEEVRFTMPGQHSQ